MIVENPRLARLGGERRQVTVLFADIVGFTNFAEKHPAEEVVAMLNEYLGEMTEIVFRWEGTLDKFVGDAVVAFWGAPVAQPNHGELALRCALHMIRRVEELHPRWTAAGWPPLCVGIGLNTGEVIVGNIGAEGKKMDYTVIGDPVNLGARVESLTRSLGCHLLITDFTLEQVRDLVAAGGFGHLRIAGRGEVNVKGKEKRVNVFQVDVRAQGDASEFQL
jgi:adenylate cyclase